jgi:hypothetical protein
MTTFAVRVSLVTALVVVAVVPGCESERMYERYTCQSGVCRDM